MSTKTYVYDCDLGQALITANNLEEARDEAVSYAGRHTHVRNVRLATDHDIEWVNAMGGRVPVPE